MIAEGHPRAGAEAGIEGGAGGGHRPLGRRQRADAVKRLRERNVRSVDPPEQVVAEDHQFGAFAAVLRRGHLRFGEGRNPDDGRNPDAEGTITCLDRIGHCRHL